MKRKLIIAASLATAGALAVAGTVMADDRDWPHSGMRGDRGHRPFVAGIIALVVLAAVVGLGVWFFMRRRSNSSTVPAPVTPFGFASPTASAEAILAERLARSEITPDEYRSSLQVLRETAAGAPPVAPWSPVPPVDPTADPTGDVATPEGDANS